MDEYDVAIVGAGPAGACAALAARRAGASVLLLDRADFPRDKPCGDGIAPHALDVLADLGVPDATAGYAAVPGLRLVGPGGDEVARQMTRPAYTIPRAVFDARIVAAAVAAGARLHRHTVRRIHQRDDHVALDGAIAARVLIGADGANSTVRRALGFPPNPDRHLAVAIRGYVPMKSAELDQRIVTSGARWPAYAWLFPIGQSDEDRSPAANIGYGEVLRGQALTRAELLERLAELLPDVDTGDATGLRAHYLPLSTHRPPPGRGRILLAGDALSLINPFTGEGIFYAVLSGALAGATAATAADATPAASYRATLHNRLGRHLRHSSTAAWLARRRWIVDRAVRAARQDARVFDTLMELGLGDGLLDARTLVKLA